VRPKRDYHHIVRGTRLDTRKRRQTREYGEEEKETELIATELTVEKKRITVEEVLTPKREGCL
jgi:hypothetical protein